MKPSQRVLHDDILERRLEDLVAFAHRSGTTGNDCALQLLSVAAQYFGACAYGLYRMKDDALICDGGGPGVSAQPHLEALQSGLRLERFCEHGRPELVTILGGDVRSIIVIPFEERRTKCVAALVFEGSIEPRFSEPQRRQIARITALLPQAFPGGQRPQHEFLLCYQPICNASSGRIARAEALLRCIDGKRRILGPLEVLGAQQAGADAFARVDEFVVENCISAWLEMQRGGVNLPLHFNIARVGDAALHVLRRKRHLAQGAGLVIEISGHAAAHDPQALPGFVAACRQFGFAVGLGAGDDFALVQKAVDSIPIDFVKLRAPSAQPGGDAHIATRAILDRAQAQHIDVIAEHVASLDDLTWARLHGVDYVQGYAVAPPMTRHDIIHWTQNYTEGLRRELHRSQGE